MSVAFEIVRVDTGLVLSESTPLDFDVVQAGGRSEFIQLKITNKGTSTALKCVMTAVAANQQTGFTTDSQQGLASETYNAQYFAADETSQLYQYAVLGSGKNWVSKVGGTLVNTNGSDVIVTCWKPPANGSAGGKKWGVEVASVYAD